MAYGNHEIWPGYFDRRFYEFNQYYSYFPKEKLPNCLELGCGLGYHSAFLSQVFDHVVSTDLEDASSEDHAIGLDRTREFLAQLGVSNVRVEGCSAEELPFPDDSFDFVYSNFVMEHVPDRSKAFKEIYRVLKPGAYHFCVVPSRFDKFYALIYYYLYLIERVYSRSIGKWLKKKHSSDSEFEREDVQNNKSMLRHFPFPPPHGAYPHYFAELIQWGTSKWKNQIEKSGLYTKVVDATTQFNPVVQIFFTLFPKWSLQSKKRWMNAEVRFGQYKIFKWIGYNAVLVYKKQEH